MKSALKLFFRTLPRFLLLSSGCRRYFVFGTSL